MDPLFRERDLAARRNENLYLNKQSVVCTSGRLPLKNGKTYVKVSALKQQ